MIEEANVFHSDNKVYCFSSTPRVFPSGGGMGLRGESLPPAENLLIPPTWKNYPQQAPAPHTKG